MSAVHRQLALTTAPKNPSYYVIIEQPLVVIIISYLLQDNTFLSKSIYLYTHTKSHRHENILSNGNFSVFWHFNIFSIISAIFYYFDNFNNFKQFWHFFNFFEIEAWQFPLRWGRLRNYLRRYVKWKLRLNQHSLTMNTSLWFYSQF